jgi:hypothetical protein
MVGKQEVGGKLRNKFLHENEDVAYKKIISTDAVDLTY